MDPIFQPLPADLSTLTDEQLAAELEARVALAQRVHDRDAELIGDRSAQDVIDEMTAGVEQIEALRAEQGERAAALEEADAELASLAERAGLSAEAEADEPVAEAEGDDAGDGDGDGEDDADEGDDAEALAAAGPPARGRQDRRRNLALGRARHAAPVATTVEEEARPLTTITAAADVPGLTAGAEVSDWDTVVRGIMERRQAFRGSTIAGREKVPVVRIHRRYDDENERLDAADPSGNARKVREMQALAASGGLCAPPTPYYDLQQISTDMRPVRDSLPRFNADRGAITFATPPTIADITTGVGIKTAAEDATGGTTAEKTCQHIECPDLNTVDVDMIYWCLQFGNLGARTWPEQVRQFTELAMSAHAREAETVLLDGIKAASTAVTATAELGAVASLLSEVLTAAVGMRSRHRMNPNATLRAMFPAWTAELLVTDMWRSQYQRFEMNRNGLYALLRENNIEPTFYIDTATGDSQVFGAQNAGALLNFPSDVVWYLFPEGSFLWLDTGTLDLGIVRDSVLNATNDYSIFGETFEEVAFIGVESLHVTTTVCNDGTVSAPRTVTCPVL